VTSPGLADERAETHVRITAHRRRDEAPLAYAPETATLCPSWPSANVLRFATVSA